MKIYVGNLSYRTSEDDLRQQFEKYGVVNQVNVITDRESGRSKGFAFVEMQNDGEGNDAIKALNGFELGDRALNVNEARPQESRPGGNRGGGGGGGGGGKSYGNRRY